MTTEAPDPQRRARGAREATGERSRRARAEPDRGRRLAPDLPRLGRRRAALGRPARAGGGDVVQLARGRARGGRRPPTWRGSRSRRTVCFEPAGGRFGAGAGYAMEFVAGTSVAPRVLRRDELAIARERLPGQLAAALAQIHTVEPGAVEGLAGGACRSGARGVRAVGGGAGRDRRAAAGGRGRPALAAPEPAAAGRAAARARRLPARQPDRRRARARGGDRLGALPRRRSGRGPRPGSCIRSWRFGNDDLPVAGLGELEPFLAAYEAAGGARPDAERLRWWEAMGNVKWAVICARQAHDHLTGARPSASSPRSGAGSASPSGTCFRSSRALPAADAKRSRRQAVFPDAGPTDRAGAARRDGGEAVRGGARVGAARAPLPGPRAGQPVRRDRPRAARRAPSPRSPTRGCSASCCGGRRAGDRSPRRPTRSRAPPRPSSRARSAPASSTTASTRRSAACASTSRRKLEIARPGYARLSRRCRAREREGVQPGAAVDADLLAGDVARRPRRRGRRPATATSSISPIRPEGMKVDSSRS